MEKYETGFLARTLASLRDVWIDLAGTESLASLRPGLEDRDLSIVRKQMIACLEGKGGEVSARKRAASLGQAYLSLNDTGRTRFLLLLAEEMGSDIPDIEAAYTAWSSAEDQKTRHIAERRLREALTAPRAVLLTQFNALPQGVKFLVDMRADIQRLLKANPSLKPLDDDLQNLLASWFDIGFLEMRSISWDSPASLLQKFMRYEAVHEMRSWDDLQNRLAADRRLFAFFHPRMPEEPLIFVEVALVTGISNNIEQLLDEGAPTEDPMRADTAIFYSISNTQAGLRGISFGNFLIKRVVDDLTRELPNLKTFSTLSPIPGFRKWLGRVAEAPDASVLSAEDQKKLSAVLEKEISPSELPMLLDSAAHLQDESLSEVLREPVTKLCARYLVLEKRGALPRDPVAKFHLSNGAQIERLNWRGDRSSNGIRQASGLMVNYLYRLNDIEKNHEKLMSDGTIAMSSQVKNLL